MLWKQHVNRAAWPSFIGYLFEVRGGLHFPDRLHESVSHYDTDVGSGVSVCFVGELTQVWLGQTVRGVSQMQAKHGRSGRLLGERDVDALLKPAPTSTRITGVQTWALFYFESIYQTDLLRIAASSTQGMLVAPRTKTPSLLLPTPAEERRPQTIRQSHDRRACEEILLRSVCGSIHFWLHFISRWPCYTCYMYLLL